MISNCVETIINGDEKEIEEILNGNRAMMVFSMRDIGLKHSIENGVLKANGTKDDFFTIHETIGIKESTLYKYLYKYNNKLIVIEDFQKILDKPVCCEMLRNAVSDDEIDRRIISPFRVVTDEFPAEFTFNGYIMLTSRMKFEDFNERYGNKLKAIRGSYKFFHIFPTYKKF